MCSSVGVSHPFSSAIAVADLNHHRISMDQHRHKLCVGYGTSECTKFKPIYVLFHKQARQGGIHIDRRVDSRILPEYCLACTCNMLAADQVKRDPQYVGCLTVHDAKQYAEAVAPSSVYAGL